MNTEISALLGKTLTQCYKSFHSDGETIEFETSDGKRYAMYHIQDCCENVYIEDIDAPLDTLVGSPIVQAEEVVSESPPDGFKHEYQPESETWTFYKLASQKGHVTIRWCGTSNGYYSERITFAEANW